MQQPLIEVALTAAAADASTIYAWDIRSGTVLASFKSASTHRNGLAIVNNRKTKSSFFVAAQQGKPICHVYAWYRASSFSKLPFSSFFPLSELHRLGSSCEKRFPVPGIVASTLDKTITPLFQRQDQMLTKFVTPEKITSVVCTASGTFCIAGTETGRIYIWEISTGSLLCTFDAHYKKVTVLRMSRDDCALISASEDASVNVWLLSTLLNEATSENATNPTPYHAWSEHTLPVTDVVCGVGSFGTARVFTASLDHTVKVWDLSTGTLLTTLLFPSFVSSMAVDPTETRLYAGCGKEGLIVQASLYRRREGSHRSRSAYEAVGGNAVEGGVEHVGIEDNDAGVAFRSVAPDSGVTENVVTCLSVNLDGTLLVAGCGDGTVNVWDTASRQAIRTFSQHKGSGAVTCAQILLKPADLGGMASLGVNGKPKVPVIQPFKRVKKLPGNADAYDEGVTVELPGSSDDQRMLQRNLDDSDLLRPVQESRTTIASLQTLTSTSALESRAQRLTEDLGRVHEHHNRIRAANDELWQVTVSEVMKGIRDARRTTTDDVKRKRTE